MEDPNFNHNPSATLQKAYVELMIKYANLDPIARKWKLLGEMESRFGRGKRK
jgi:hypothetical protein